MNLTKEFNPIVKWADARGIFEHATLETQFIKLQEEMGELAVGIMGKNHDEIKDAVGDCIVVLTILAEMNGSPIEECINSAYNIISKRKGTMINGTFVKETE